MGCLYSSPGNILLLSIPGNCSSATAFIKCKKPSNLPSKQDLIVGSSGLNEVATEGSNLGNRSATQ